MQGATAAALHLCKLAVGASDVAHLRIWQAERLSRTSELHHRTRNFPRRAAELLDGGSIYWVIGGALLVRQRLLDIRREPTDAGPPFAFLVLDPLLVPVRPRPMRPFQGWRYLQADAAPPDLAAEQPAQTDHLPLALQRDLRALHLL